MVWKLAKSKGFVRKKSPEIKNLLFSTFLHTSLMPSNVAILFYFLVFLIFVLFFKL